MMPEPPIPWDTALHAEHVAAAEAIVVDWVWARNASWEHLEPFHDERHGKRPNPRRLPNAPEQKSDAQLYGFDGAGRMVVSRTFGDGFGNDDVVRHEWLRLGDRQFEYEMLGARGRYRRVLTEQRVAAHEEGRPMAVDRWSFLPHDDAYFYGRETYEYEAGRLVRVVIHANRQRELRLTYTPDGELLAIADGNDAPVYRRPVPGGVGRARKLLHAELPNRIAAWAQRVLPDEPVAYLAVIYGETFSQVLPPMLVLATRREIAAGGTWYPDEFERFDDDPEELEGFDEPSDVLNQEWRSTEDEHDARTFVRAVADAVPGLPFPVVALGPSLYDLDLDVPQELQREILGDR